MSGVLGVFCDGEEGLGFLSNNRLLVKFFSDIGECFSIGFLEFLVFFELFWDILDILGMLLLVFVIKLLFKGKFLIGFFWFVFVVMLDEDWVEGFV